MRHWGTYFGEIEDIEEAFAGEDAGQHVDLTGQYCSTHKKDDPALEEMKETVGHFGAPAIDRHSNEANSDAVHCNGDRNGGQKHHRALPQGSLKQIGGKKTEAQERVEVSQPATRLDHL